MTIFKTCPTCETTWLTRNEFIADSEVLLKGYQSAYTVSEPGLFLFDHSCGSTIAVDADDFEDMYDEDICQQCEAHTERHPSHCCKELTGEDAVTSCVCKFSKTIECKLEEIMANPMVDG